MAISWSDLTPVENETEEPVTINWSDLTPIEEAAQPAVGEPQAVEAAQPVVGEPQAVETAQPVIEEPQTSGYVQGELRTRLDEARSTKKARIAKLRAQK